MSSEAELDAILQHIDQLLHEVGEEAQRAGTGRLEGVLAAHRSRVYDALNAIGEWLALFRLGSPDGSQTIRIRQQINDQLLRWSSSSPIYTRMRDVGAGQGAFFELMQHIHSRRPSGASISAIIISDYINHLKIIQASRNRFELISEAIEREVRARVVQGRSRIDVLCLQYAGGAEILRLLQDSSLASVLHLTCVDGSTEGARHANQTLTALDKARIRVLRRTPLRHLEGPRRSTEMVDLVYALSLPDYLDENEIGRLVRGAARALRPGGALLLGGMTRDVPVGERMLRANMMDKDASYRDERDWLRLLTGAPFDLEEVRFQREPLGIALVLSAPRQ